MPHQEILGERPLTYSAWHRRDSIARFLAGDRLRASRLTMVDLDAVYVEAKHPYDRPPVAIMETFQVYGHMQPNTLDQKNGSIVYQLSKAANVPSFKVAYLPSETRNPADPRWPDVQEFAVREMYPARSPLWNVMTPDEYAKFLLMLRGEHIRIKRNGSQMPLLPYGDTADERELLKRWQFIQERDF